MVTARKTTGPGRSLNVAMVIRPQVPGRHGGDLVQAEMTARELSKKDVRVTISSGEEIPRADIVHVFNMQTPHWTLQQVARATKEGKPVVLSPIYWSSLISVVGALMIFPRLLPFLPNTLAENGPDARDSGRGPFPLLPLGHRRKARQILRLSRLILPNSTAEALQLQAEYPELLSRSDALKVVPNGADAGEFEGGAGGSAWGEGLPEPGEYILCVARIDFRKNQLRLIDAIRDLGLSLVCVGDPVLTSPWHVAYYNACKGRGGGVTFLTHRGPRELWPLYYNCALHCLPSYFETPGLSNLEAALSGARVVTTPYGATREYFGNLAQYCNPNSVSSIRLAIERSLQAPMPPGLRELVRDRFTWRRAAEVTLEAYYQVLGESGAST